MREFYRQMLLPIGEEGTDSFTRFDLNGGSRVLHAIPEQYAVDVTFTSPPRVREESPVKLIFGVDDVPAERARLEAMGVAILQRAWQNPAESCDGVDPEGNVFQLAGS